ncbi:methylated-DNA--[protein]-cysteine S-methyltransferase [Agarivorans sp. QJM3NY_25]|uniref:methylated-DNA--[protein]-cysteine S-methyltransferase n=1 Tax=Agarivorans sp. QJM3NY_25 TaxID=3421430 RepID=UPI003D7CF716
MADTDARIVQVAQRIETDADEALNLEELARQAAISPCYLQRKFKATFGVSPKIFQNAIRINRLKQSLKKGGGITDAIFEAGFGSTSRVYEQVNRKLGMTPSAYRDGGKNLTISFALRTTFFGQLMMAATERGVCFVHLADDATHLLQTLHREFPNAQLVASPEDMSHELDLWIEALESHLAGKGPKPDLPLHLRGTAFQISVWKFLMSVEDGQQVSYKQVAEGINAPKSFRAVANACGANNIAILIPCHRVLRGDGQLGGYRWGGQRKAKLLSMEADRKR